ncbi:hypothetical protein JQK87_06155 [Streptomyces sp. G44]|uniref:hypothetical protein n=1 Tax=Streptomyces sp. G44 TaxID=2807632 RepID=UPI00195F7459|nr:hypothetical protein [Streptomyces sp. G44]MBM7167998.1 hypothetical protein [Streptomyces sp. G44]
MRAPRRTFHTFRTFHTVRAAAIATGVIAACAVPATAASAAETPGPPPPAHQAVPKGGVKAGDERGTPGEPAEGPLVAAGGGMAALGAAGLGLAVRRRRHDG